MPYCNKSNKYKFGIQNHAYYNGEILKITNYDENIHKNKIFCRNDHELIYVKKNNTDNSYFKHKCILDMRIEDTPMTDWHVKWQGKFIRTEILFPLKPGQIKERIADAVIKNNFVVEFQHSYIKNKDITERSNDYALHGYKIIWIIDGHDIKVNKNSYNEIYLTIPAKSVWKYKKFINQDIILIDINNTLYKLYPKYVKSNMISVEIANRYDDISINVLPQCNLFIKQQGAGNGKTYTIINMIDSNEFESYKQLLYLTKQHSAKHIILQEFKSQMKSLNISNVDIMIRENGKKYKITYEKNNSKRIMIIATIDSFLYTLGYNNNNDIKYIDMFEGCAREIANGCTKFISTHTYTSTQIHLNKELCILIDESQDLPYYYGQAIITLMKNHYINVYIVGDKLQSISSEHNIFNQLKSLHIDYINKIEYPPINICRRFTSNTLINFVNQMIKFDEYNLPKIQNSDDIDIGKIHMIKLSASSDKELKNVGKLMEKYIEEVEVNNRNPNDFLIVTPFTKQNPLVNALELAIDNYWNQKSNNKNYNQYVIFHKSEEGGAIDLSKSDNSTRIVSIHTAKGDGRPVVFVIGLTEKGLQKFSKYNNNLVYESLLHVSITRQKETLYFAYVNNNDNIQCRLFKANQIVTPSILIKNKLTIKNIVNLIKDDDSINIPTNLFTERNKKQIIIDMSHHNIRYICMIISFMIKANNKGNNVITNRQYNAIINNLFNISISQTSSYEIYLLSLQYIYATKIKKDLSSIYTSKEIKIKIKKEYPTLLTGKTLFLYISSKNRDYIKYYNIIIETINNIKAKIKHVLFNDEDLSCPYESVILYFLIESIEKGLYTDISIMELYDITHNYYLAFDNQCELKSHNNCKCKILFNNPEVNNASHLSTYIKYHYDDMIYINDQYNLFLKPNIRWLFNHKITYSGLSNDYSLYEFISHIGYDDENVYLVYVIPYLMDLNYNKTLIKAIFDSALLKNSANNDKSSNYERFYNKKVYSVIFSTNQDYIIIECNTDDIINIIKTKMIKHYIIESNDIRRFYTYYYNKYKNSNESEEEHNIYNKYKLHKTKTKKYKIKYPSFVDQFFDLLQSNDPDQYINYDFTEIITKSVNNYFIE